MGEDQAVQFKSGVASKVFDALVDFFIEDYMVKRYVSDKSGWRTLPEIAQRAQLPPSSLYGKSSTFNPSLDEILRRGLIETRIFPGERGRGGEVMRLRIAYEKDPVREIVSSRIRLGKRPDKKESPSTAEDPFEEKVEQVLEESQLLSSLSKGEIRRIIRNSERPTFSASEFIVREGDVATGFFIIVEGQAEARQKGKSVRRMGRGQFFGETALTEPPIRSADVVALQPTTCLKLDSARLKELINLNPEIAIKLLDETVRRNRDLARESLA